MIQEGWTTFKLGDIINIKHGYAFKGEYFTDEPTQHLLLTPGNFNIGGGFKMDKSRYYNGEYPKEYILNEGDIIITMTDLSKEGDTLGYSAKIPPHKSVNYLHNQRLGLVKFKSREIDSEFLYWILRTEPYHYFIVGSASGSTVKHTSPSRISKYQFKAPSKIYEQSRIASILSSLDDKIELNLQMNKTLEAIAKAIFKEWFVDFRFPGFDGELVDGLPKGWRMSKVSDTCKVNANTLSYKDEMIEIQYIEISEVERGIIKNIKNYRRGEEPSRARRTLSHGDIVLSTVRPDRGAYFLAYEPDDNLIASTGFAVFSPTNVPYSFLYSFLSAEEQIDYYGRMADGAAYPAVNPSVIMNINIVIPTQEILMLFDHNIGILYSKIYENLKENRYLSQLRDMLLPKLMTGKIRVA